MLSTSIFGTNETGFPCKLLLTKRHVGNLGKDLPKQSSAATKISENKNQDVEDNIISLSGFLGAFIGNLAE